MKQSNRTKLLLAAELKQIAKLKPFARITVSELCQRCGVDRRTFYYHFRDVYDLSAWIFNQTVDACMTERDGYYDAAELVLVMDAFRSDPDFYRRALDEDSQNSLGRHVLRHNVTMFEAAARKIRGTEELSAEDRFDIRYHSYGILFSIRRWLFSECRESPEEMARLLLHAAPPIIKEIYRVEPEKKGARSDA